MKKKMITLALIVLVLSILAWQFSGSSSSDSNDILVAVKQGEFKILVTTTGELEAKHSEEIHGPEGLREFRIWQVKINDMVPDGTVVDSGQWVADLDRSELMNKIKDEESELEKLESQFIKTRLDTSMDLRQAREELINLGFELEEQKIKLEQSIYEPPATIRQAEIDMQKTQRSYNQTEKNYALKLEKANANMQEVSASLNQSKRKIENMYKVIGNFTIRAPKSGMVIYRRNWDGSKQGIGSTINSGWNNVVATLPNLTEMISKTYVNEIDISKVTDDQNVEIGVDAFPDKHFTGKVLDVANIGEQMRNSNAKVFEVKIEVNEFDSVLRPAMTTMNSILTEVIDDALFIPIECIQNNDSISYVVTSKKVRREVKLGKSNENEIIVEAGLQAGEEVYLTIPEAASNYKLITLKD